MRAARSSTGTGGNPNVGVPVHFTRFPKSFFRLHCAPCPPPPPTFSPPTPSPSQDLSAREPLPQPYDDILQAETKNTAELAVSEGYNFASLARDSLFHHLNPVLPALSSPFSSSPSFSSLSTSESEGNDKDPYFSSLSYSESDENDDKPVCFSTVPVTDSIGGNSGCPPRFPPTDTPQS